VTLVVFDPVVALVVLTPLPVVAALVTAADELPPEPLPLPLSPVDCPLSSSPSVLVGPHPNASESEAAATMEPTERRRARRTMVPAEVQARHHRESPVKTG
jgi:hypothetical protein